MPVPKPLLRPGSSPAAVGVFKPAQGQSTSPTVSFPPSISWSMPQVEQGTQPTAYAPNALDDMSQSISKTTAFIKQGQIAAISGLPAVTFTTGTTTITLAIPAANVTFADGSILPFNGGTINFVGLTATTQYYLDLAYNLNTGVWTGALYLAPPTTIQILQDCSQDGFVPYFTGYSDSSNTKTTTSGSGGGSGGGGGSGPSCPAAHQKIETLEKGLIRADQLEVGMNLRAPNGGWHRIHALKPPMPCTVYRILTDKGAVEVNEGHMVKSARGEWVLVTALRIGTA